jgi:spheroidene monooxygenase
VVGKVAVVVLIDVAASARWWGFWYFLFCRFQLARAPGLTFKKVLGSGKNGGFGLKPSPSHQALFCVFRDEDAADDFIARSAVLANYRAHAREFFTVKLKAFSSRGAWSHVAPFSLEARAPVGEPVAALTRASIRPSVAKQFWQRAPAAERSLHQASGCLLAMGVGEAPLLRQATFTIWESIGAMDAYARTGAHMEAIRAATAGNFFSESMFARFVPFDAAGVWQGRAAENILPRRTQLEELAPCVRAAS